MMENLDNQLKRALTRKDPPPDFTAKVMARIHDRKAEPEPAWWFLLLHGQRAALAAGMAGLMVIAGAGAAYHQHQVEQQRRAETARDQLVLALRITSVQLNRIGRVLATGKEER
jgi:hypothetical protein